MGNSFRRCCDGCKEEEEPKPPTTTSAAVTPINTSSTPSLNVPLVSVLRKSSSPPMRHGSTLLSPLLDDQSGLGYGRATTTTPASHHRIVRIETASPIPFVETNYDDDAETESEDSSREASDSYLVPPVLPENSSGLRRMLHASQYREQNNSGNTSSGSAVEDSEQRNETKDEETPASPGHFLRRVERRSSLQSVDVDSPRFAPFPVDKVRQSSISNLLDGTMTLGILVDGAQDDDALVQDLLALGWAESFVCGRTAQEVANFEREVAMCTPDIVVLSNIRFVDEGFEFTACELAHNLRVNGYLGCIIILVTSPDKKDEYVDFSKVDGLLEQGPLTRSEIKSSIAIALGIAQRRRASITATPSMPPSLQNSVNSTFAFGSIGGGAGGEEDDGAVTPSRSNDDDD